MLPEQIRLRDHSTVFCFIRLLGNNESYAVATHILSQPGIVFSLLLADPRLPTTHLRRENRGEIQMSLSHHRLP